MIRTLEPASPPDVPAEMGGLEPLNEWHQVAKYLHCGRTHVFALMKAGDLDSVKVGKKRLVPASSVIALVDSLRRDAERHLDAGICDSSRSTSGGQSHA